jgi:hypothetical protein
LAFTVGREYLQTFPSDVAGIKKILAALANFSQITPTDLNAA